MARFLEDTCKKNICIDPITGTLTPKCTPNNFPRFFLLTRVRATGPTNVANGGCAKSPHFFLSGSFGVEIGGFGLVGRV